MAKGYQDDTVSLSGKSVTLYSLLSDNRDFADADCPASGQYLLQQAFRIAGAKFEVFDGETTDVIVPYGEGRQIILELGQIDPQRDLAKLYALLRARQGLYRLPLQLAAQQAGKGGARADPQMRREHSGAAGGVL